jgi:hypothetical protein
VGSKVTRPAICSLHLPEPVSHFLSHTMSLMMTPAASCKPFARAPARAGARRSVALCRAQAVEPARFVLPGAKALTAAAAAALLAVRLHGR